jgi:hypothetical protein
MTCELFTFCHDGRGQQTPSQYLTTYMDVSGLLHGSVWYTVHVY